jgi:hypothetical protein
MGLLNSAAGITQVAGAAQTTFGALSNVSGVAANLKGAFDVAKGGDILGAIRSANLPAAGELVGDIMTAVSLFSDENDPNDWRVRLSLPKWVSFKNSSVLAPLKDAGGMVFPYTPTISINQSAKYTPVSPVHTNYPFQAYQNSDPGTITITAPMFVEDASQGQYWVAALHYLRSVTKMFSGADMKSGNPPPIVFLNGYGQYVFKNIPVVITSVQVQMEKDVDYIACPVMGSSAGEISSVAESIGGLAGLAGGFIPQISAVTSTIGSIAGTVSSVSNVLGAFGVGGSTSAGTAHVPSKSTFTVVCTPVYSRESVRKFSLDRFVTGGYVSSTFGYL